MSKEISVRERILAANETAASDLRKSFEATGTLVVNLISSPGSGKTTLLESTVRALKPHYGLAGLEGDIATERDADRLRRLGIPARQILTGGACHLDARLIHSELARAKFPKMDILFIENVGNLICPTSYDLGEDFKVALLSTAEGDDKPFKYPAIFARSAVTVITKADLLPYVEFDLKAVEDQVRTLNPEGVFIVTSARSGEGLDKWCQLLETRLSRKRQPRNP